MMSRPTSLWRSGIDSARSWTACLRRIQPGSQTRCHHHHHLRHCRHGQPQHPLLWPMALQPPPQETQRLPRGHEACFQSELPGDDHYSWSMVQPCPATEYPKRLSQPPPWATNPTIHPTVRGHDAHRSAGNHGHFGLHQSSSSYSLHSIRLRSDPLYRCEILGMNSPIGFLKRGRGTVNGFRMARRHSIRSLRPEYSLWLAAPSSRSGRNKNQHWHSRHSIHFYTSPLQNIMIDIKYCIRALISPRLGIPVITT
jgi:hypothetical protein